MNIIINYDVINVKYTYKICLFVLDDREPLRRIFSTFFILIYKDFDIMRKILVKEQSYMALFLIGDCFSIVILQYELFVEWQGSVMRISYMPLVKGNVNEYLGT